MARVQAADGYFRILGRVDDVINIAVHPPGHQRTGVRLLDGGVAEAAAVPVTDELRGRAVEMYVALKPGYVPNAEVEERVRGAIETIIGKIARPKNVWIVPYMPKTRSGKIMRRVIVGISNFVSQGDITTLANPEIVETIRRHVQSARMAHGDLPANSRPRNVKRSDGTGWSDSSPIASRSWSKRTALLYSGR